MYKFSLFILLIFISNCNVQKNESEFFWNLEKELVHNQNRSDPAKWSTENWKVDTSNLSLNGRPFINGVFPVSDYDLVDSTFSGLGNSGDWKGYNLDDKKVICHSLYVKANNVNAHFIKDKPNEVFFSILVLTDSVDLSSYAHTYVSVTSRNHPHVAGQGFVKTKSNRIDFMSFLTADRNAYAVVNMRLFDLRIGRIVLIAPQKDRTLRSLQLDAPIMSSEEMTEHINALLEKDQKVASFFKSDGNI